MNNKHNESYDSRGKNASHDQSHQSAFISPEKGKYGKDAQGDEADPRESLKEAFDIAKRLLIDGQPQQASDKCMKALKDANEIFGENSAESLPGYFILAEANIEEGKLKRAEDFLIGAYWNLLKHSQDEKQAAGNTSNINQKGEVLDEKEYMSYKGTLHKVFAKLYSAKREFDRALDELKNGIYIDSCHYGPEDIQTSISYFNFGQILIKSGDPEKGYTFYNQGIKIWYKFFKLMMRNTYNENVQVDDIIIKQGLSQLKGAEVLFLDRLKSEGEDEVIEDIYKLNYALAFIHKFIGEEDAALEYCRNIEGYLLGRYQQNHPKLNRFYNFFPNYQDHLTREEGEEGEEDQDENYERGYENRGYKPQTDEDGDDNDPYENNDEENNEEERSRDESESDSVTQNSQEKPLSQRSEERPISQNSQDKPQSQKSQERPMSKNSQASHHSEESKHSQSHHSQNEKINKSQESQKNEEKNQSQNEIQNNSQEAQEGKEESGEKGKTEESPKSQVLSERE